MTEIVLAREGWLPRVIREDDRLRVELGAGADALHQPRTFAFPIDENHLVVLREDLTRHLLLWSAILPLCDAAGINRPLDEPAAVALLDPILFGTPVEVEVFFRDIRWDKRQLVAQGARVALLDRGELFAALRFATETSDWQRVRDYDANRDRARRGVRLGPLDAALLKYTDRYRHGGKVPVRKPAAVDARLLREVMAVIATAEQAGAGMSMSPDLPDGRAAARRHREWRDIERAVEHAVRRAHPELVEDAVRTVSFLMCAEAAARGRASGDPPGR